MSDFRDASFIPAQPPHNAILDYSHTLSAPAMTALESQAVSLQSVMKVKAVILPGNFKVDNMTTFSRDLGETWHVAGKRLLIVVDMKDHKVKMLAGRELANSGLDGQTITNQIIPQDFVPYMKKGDLQGALSNSMTAASNVVQQGATTTSSVTPYTASRTKSGTTYPGSYSNAQAPHEYSLWNTIQPFVWIGIACVGVYVWSLKSRANENKKLIEQFKERVGPLYEQADSIGAASEYLKTDANADLAQRVATFFNRLTTFEKAQTEAEHYAKGNKPFQTRDAYLNLIRMIGLLMPEAEQLKADVNAVTGGVETYKAPKQISLTDQAAQVKAAEEASHTIKIPESVAQSDNFRRPSWSYQPAYYQPVDNGMTGLASMMMQMQMMQIGMNAMNHNNYGGGGGWFGNTGGWGNNNDNNSGGSWGGGGGGWDGGGGGGGGSDFDMGGGGWDSGGGGDSGGDSGGGGDW